MDRDHCPCHDEDARGAPSGSDDHSGDITEMVRKLRDYNRWRRGADDLDQPDPTDLGCLLEASADLLENFNRGTPMPLTMDDQDADSYQIDGEHYQRPISPWMIIESYDLDYFEASALAYLLRRKPGISRATDLRKCAHYLHKCIERAERT